MESIDRMKKEQEVANAFFQEISSASDTILFGKPEILHLSLICLIARGHLLIEDVPGVGKTTLAKGLSSIFDGDFKRVQFTSDLLPSDILGVSIYNQHIGEFKFQPGPVFCDVLLADEINRGSPRTQSALLQVMEEREITVDGRQIQVSPNFLVIATQNPFEMSGTFPLPEAQIDRFLFKLRIGYPNLEAERQILELSNSASVIRKMVDTQALENIRMMAMNVYASRSIVDYIIRIVSSTRDSGMFKLGASPRASVGLLKTARIHALSLGRNYVIPSDVLYLAPYILSHRVVQSSGNKLQSATWDSINELLSSIEMPPVLPEE